MANLGRSDFVVFTIEFPHHIFMNELMMDKGISYQKGNGIKCNLLCLCSAKQSIGIKDSKCPKIVQRQQQDQQQARNSKDEIQGSQISLMRRRRRSVLYLLSRKIWL